MEVDLGNLMAYDSHYYSVPSQQSREELVNEFLQKGIELVQAIADSLFTTLTSTEDVDGRTPR
ncbi:ribosome biogenesis regulatory protein [Trifolium medium]|uniref:Ribosome biogenesis regulatory protein n=1 Tax=Trifolium medium TaxID=97028 RepID=A0A392R0S3_9FABA|nr:ribosome biogenesis regulatory protein [Trifolium medium]